MVHIHRVCGTEIHGSDDEPRIDHCTRSLKKKFASSDILSSFGALAIDVSNV